MNYLDKLQSACVVFLMISGCGGGGSAGPQPGVDGGVDPSQCLEQDGLCLPAFKGLLVLDKPLPNTDATRYEFEGNGWDDVIRCTFSAALTGAKEHHYIALRWSQVTSFDENKNASITLKGLEGPGDYSAATCFDPQICPDCAPIVKEFDGWIKLWLPAETGLVEINNDLFPPVLSFLSLNLSIPDYPRGTCGGGKVPYMHLLLRMENMCAGEVAGTACNGDCPEDAPQATFDLELLCPEYEQWEPATVGSNICECPGMPHYGCAND